MMRVAVDRFSSRCWFFLRRVVSFSLLVSRCYRSASNGNKTEKLTTVQTGNNAKHSVLCHSYHSSYPYRKHFLGFRV